MTDEELQEEIQDVREIRDNLPRPSAPLPQHDVRRREMLLLRELTLYKMEDAKKRNKKDLELLNTQIYDLIISFTESY